MVPGERVAVERVCEERVRVHRLLYRDDAAEAALRGFGVLPYQKYADGGGGDAREFKDIAQRDAGPFAVADGAGHPLRSVCRTSLHQVEHSAVISGALKVGNERAAGEIRYPVVG